MSRHGRKQTNTPAGKALLEKVTDVYATSLAQSTKAQTYLKTLGFADISLLERFHAGYCTGRLRQIMPGDGQVREELIASGIVDNQLREFFLGCLVFPLCDPEGAIISMAGRHIGQNTDVFLPEQRTGLWNVQAARLYPEVHLGCSILDGLALQAAGMPNSMGVAGVTITEHDIETLSQCGVHKVLVWAEPERAENIVKALSRFDAQRSDVPGHNGPHGYAAEYGAEALRSLVENGIECRTGRQRSLVSHGPSRSLRLTFAQRTYEIRGLEKGERKLRATVRIEHAGRLHVDTLDLYSARSRKHLCMDLSRLFEEPATTIESDMAEIVKACESHDPAAVPEATDPAVTMTEAERREAEDFGKQPGLLDSILADFETCGLVGEEANKLLYYLAAVSRKMPEPLSVLILASSGAGKSTLQDMTLSMCPPEDVVKLTSLSGKALFYKSRTSLKHKILALEEGVGAEDADYAIRNLISSGQLIIEATIKDLASGKLTTMENRVEGPTAVFITTTDPDPDPETRSRFFVTGVDESRDQTRAILAFQRRSHTLEGHRTSSAIARVIKRHHNFQRLLKPYAVINPYAERLVYADDRLQSRRNQPKYLNLINAVAFLHQMQKEPRVMCGTSDTRYLEVEPRDVEAANELAREVLFSNVDDLNAVSRSLLGLIGKLVDERLAECEKPGPVFSEIEFTRRQLREYCGWSHSRIRRYLAQLVELELIAQETRGRHKPYCYRLLVRGYEDQCVPFVDQD